MKVEWLLNDSGRMTCAQFQRDERLTAQQARQEADVWSHASAAKVVTRYPPRIVYRVKRVA